MFLNGCGFSPLYKEKNLKNGALASHHLTIKVEKNGYTSMKLQNILEKKKHLIEQNLKNNASLTVSSTEEYAPVGISNDGLTTRTQGRIAIDLTLTQKINPLISKTAHFDHVSSYNMDEGDSFACERTQSSVRLRLLEILSDQIVQETLYLLE